jgi:hypothetical protein
MNFIGQITSIPFFLDIFAEPLEQQQDIDCMMEILSCEVETGN